MSTTTTIQVLDAVDTIWQSCLPATMKTGWERLTERMVGCPCMDAPWGQFVTAHAVTTSDGFVRRSVPLPYPVRLTDEEVAEGRLLPAVTERRKLYTGTMTLTLSRPEWKPSFASYKDKTTGLEKACLSIHMHLSPGEKSKAGTACRVMVTLEGLRELSSSTMMMMKVADAKEEEDIWTAWKRFVAEWNATFFPAEEKHERTCAAPRRQ